MVGGRTGQTLLGEYHILQCNNISLNLYLYVFPIIKGKHYHYLEKKKKIFE